jgi:catechol 2,3-dioxygenase
MTSAPDMTQVSSPADAELATFGPVHLDVTDAERSVDFWRDRVGLQLTGEEQNVLHLGTADETLLVLYPGATGPAPRGHAGLYHLAIHLPNEPEFARVLARLFDRRTFMSPTDHVMSKSIYLDDPDGNGLEFTLETPERVRSMRITPNGSEVIDASGRQRSGRDLLDVREILSHLPDDDIDRPLPVKTKIGHVHLHVGDIADGQRFYRDTLGFADSMSMGSMADFHANGRFKHRIAINTWQGTGASQPPAGNAGLRHFTIRFDTPERLHDALARVDSATPHPDGHLVHDPSGNAMILTS